MRKWMTKEVTKTTVKVARMEVAEGGLPKAVQLDDQVLIGNVSLEKAQKEVAKKFAHPVTVFGVEPDTVTYRMKVEDFIQAAEIVTPDNAAETNADDSGEAGEQASA